MASAAFWNWVNAQGLIPSSDPNYYSSGQAAQDPNAYAHALSIAIQNVKNKPIEIQNQFFSMLQAEGGMSADSNSGYYSTIPFGSGDMNHLITTAAGAFNAQYGGQNAQSIPRNSKLVQVGGAFRVVWDLGDGLGHAWYSMDAATAQNIFGAGYVPNFTFSNVGQFEDRFGNNYWGDVREIDLKAETPWEDLDSRIEAQFGHVPGFSDPDIRRLMRQAFFETWSPDQFQVEYRKTSYYQNSTDQQRQWAGLSQAERNQRIAETDTKMKQEYRRLFGAEMPVGYSAGIAEQIASGVTTFDSWAYGQASAAGGQTGTPEHARRFAEQQAANSPQNQIENMTKFANDQYLAWVGPGALPANFAASWGKNLATGDASEADLEAHLKTLSQARWAYKDPNVSWEDWAAPFKAEIGDTLELGSVMDTDPLLGSILRSDLTGVDLNAMIRKDKRFLSTQKMYEGLAGAAADMGRRFGFIT